MSAVAQPTVRRAPRRRRPTPAALALNVLTYLVAFVVFFPILWTVLTSLKTEAQAASTPPVFLFHVTFGNYRTVFDANYFSFFENTVILSVGSTLLAMLLGLPAAYSLAFHPSPRTPKVLSWVLSTKMLPAVGALIPLIVIYKRVHLFDTRLGMILLYAAFNLPLVIWMMRSFFADLPKEILEAATVDGAGFLRIMTRIVLPLTAPGLAATALLSLIFSWNEFLLAVNLTGANTGTLPVFISGFMTSEGLFWAQMSAASTLAIAPVILAGWLAQRSLVRGLTFGAVK
ncbi:MAG: polyol transport system permease protein [Gaiellaceae bacterium]|jgi:sorbitol/mannitol transport system permease protein|nr:polyol transport system permease protein [Gaiellaceae bacterium]